MDSSVINAIRIELIALRKLLESIEERLKELGKK